jgi:outer membrane protein assembly factor BamB
LKSRFKCRRHLVAQQTHGGAAMRFTPIFVAGILAASSAGAWCSEWPQFRGVNGSGTSGEQGLPVHWSADKNVAWKIKLPGYGWSCPVVWKDKVFVTTAVTDKQTKPKGGFGMMKGKTPTAVYSWEIHCLNAADGTTLWKRVAAERKPAIATNPTNGYATETPATDGERVYAYFGGIGMVYCFNLSGDRLWSANLGAHAVQFGHGTASSPALADGRLFIQCDNEEESFLVALDATTGKELWRTPRAEGTGWSSPLVWRNTARMEIVCIGSPRTRSYDPETGKQLWELGGFPGQVKASAVADKSFLFVGSGGFGSFGDGPGGKGPGGFPKGPGGFGKGPFGKGRPLFAVKAGATGDLTLKAVEKSNNGVVWRLANGGASTASPLLYDGYLYILEDKNGIVTCYDARNGEKRYKERLPGAAGFTSSPWAYGGKVFCQGEEGTTYVLNAGPAFELVSENRLEEMTWSSPAAAGGALFLRTVDHLFCIREMGKKND